MNYAITAAILLASASALMPSGCGDDSAIRDCDPGEVFIAEGCPRWPEILCTGYSAEPIIDCGYHLLHAEPGQWDAVCVAECSR